MTSSTTSVVNKGERQIARSIVVDAPAPVLFEILANPHRHREVDGSGTVREAASTGHRMMQGETFAVRMKMFGIPYTMTSTTTELVPDRVVEWRHPGGHRWRYDLEPLGPNQTRVTETWDYRDARTPRLYDLIGYRSRNARGIEQTLARMKEQFD
jgi:hypothetical protein